MALRIADSISSGTHTTEALLSWTRKGRLQCNPAAALCAQRPSIPNAIWSGKRVAPGVQKWLNPVFRYEGVWIPTLADWEGGWPPPPGFKSAGGLPLETILNAIDEFGLGVNLTIGKTRSRCGSQDSSWPNSSQFKTRPWSMKILGFDQMLLYPQF